LGGNALQCTFGETAQSIDAFYRRKGPKVWRDYQTSLYHSTLSYGYGKAADRTWLPMLSDLPPLGECRNLRALAEWGLEALLEATPLFGIIVLVLTFRAGTTKSVALSSKGHL